MLDEDGYITPPPEHTTLPGGPRKTLVKKVRSVLWRYIRCRPERRDECWRMAWEWARASADRWSCARRRWPSENEIASQYLLLALARMRESHQLRLPIFASETVPESIRKRFAANLAISGLTGIIGIEHVEQSAPVAQMDGAPLS